MEDIVHFNQEDDNSIKMLNVEINIRQNERIDNFQQITQQEFVDNNNNGIRKTNSVPQQLHCFQKKEYTQTLPQINANNK